MNHPDTTAWYAYCVTDSVPPGVERIAGVETDTGLEAIQIGSLWVVAGRVPLADYEEDVLKERIRDIAWLEPRVRRHEAANLTLFESVDMIPLRFGTIFRSRESLVAAFAATEPELAATYDRLRGKGEWTVKVFVPDDQLVRLAESTDDELKAAEAAVAGLSPGMAFFQKKKLEALRAAALDRAGTRVADSFTSRLVDLGCSVRVRENLDKRLTERPADTQVLNAAVLAPRGFSGTIETALRNIVTDWTTTEVAVDAGADGPWPPFRFVL